MPTISDGLFDGPITSPMSESSRWPGGVPVFETPERVASGNLPMQPEGNPVRPLDADGPVPWKGLTSGR